MTCGMLEISKINPDRMKAGKKAVTIEAWAATNWFLDKVEMSRPRARAAIKKTPETSRRLSQSPLKGI